MNNTSWPAGFSLPASPLLRRFARLFLVIMVVVLASHRLLPDAPLLHYVSKPAIMLSLLGLLLLARRGAYRPTDRVMTAAMLFACAGDVFLMLPGESWFLPGLGAFLVTQLLYAYVFAREGQPALLRRQPWLSFPLIAYLLLLMFAIWDGLGALKAPVLVYGLAISAMVLMAMLRRPKVSAASFVWVLAGAVLFMASDSLIAWHRFAQPFEGSKDAIMLSYMLGQYFIVNGYLRAGESAEK